MAHAIRFHQPGGPEVLRLEETAVGTPGPDQAKVRHVAVGLNFADTYFRTGMYPAPLPSGRRLPSPAGWITKVRCTESATSTVWPSAEPTGRLPGRCIRVARAGSGISPSA